MVDKKVDTLDDVLDVEFLIDFFTRFSDVALQLPLKVEAVHPFDV